MAAAMALPRNGSSPLPSAILPHLGSLDMSTIGLYVQHIPSALASAAAILADSSTASISQLHESPRGMGNTVS